MVPIESVVTLVSALVIALIILIKIVRRNIQARRINHDRGLLASAESRTNTWKDFEILKQGLKSGGISKRTGAAFIIQVIFGLAVFAGFSGWAYYLWQGAFIELVAVSAVLALIGLAMPFVVWSVTKKRNLSLAQIDARLVKIESKLREQPVKSQTAPKPETKIFQHVEQSQAEKIPQDSILRRHYLAHKAAELEAIVNPYPTDSVLKRHQEHMLKTGFEAEVQKLAQEISVETQRIVEPDESHIHIPEDSVLKRHFLSQLRAEIEATLFPRPTDSVLKRHYEALLESMLDNKLSHFH